MKNLKHLFPILTFLCLPFSGISQKETKECLAEGVRCVYNIENGMMNGAYNSFYTNGTKHAEGQFQHNLRVGKWMIYDSTGSIQHQRTYENNALHFTVSKHKLGASNATVGGNKVNFQMNENGFYALPPINEKDIVHSTRYWRMVRPQSINTALFKDKTFYNWLISSVLEGKFIAYRTIDKVWNKMTPDEVKKRLDSLGVELVSFRIKEERFFSDKWQASQTTILGIAPVMQVKDAAGNISEMPLFWLRMPNIRGELVKQKIEGTGVPSYVKNYDDLFFYRYFSSEIVAQSNVQNKRLSEMVSSEDLKKEQQKIEIGMIELEHNLWDYVHLK
jgi:Gliding motility associated protein GldN